MAMLGMALLATFWIALSHAPAGAMMIGDPAASAPRRQIQVESEIDYSQRDVTLSEICCLESEALRLLVKISGRLSERVELFGRLGGVVLQTLESPGVEIEGSASIAIGGGLKVTLHEAGPVAWGVGAQVLYYDTDDDSLGLETSWHELDFFAGPSIAVRPDVRLYGGLLGSLIVGDLSGPGGSLDLAELRPLGMFLGGRVVVTRAVFFGMELRLIDELAVASRVGITF
jgi:hypothetical protein